MSENISKLHIMVGTKGIPKVNQDFSKMEKGIDNLNGTLTKMEKGMRKTSTATTRASKSNKIFNANIIESAVAASIAIKGLQELKSFITGTTVDYAEQESTMLKAEAVMRSTGGTAGYTVDQMHQYAVQLEKTTGIHKAALINAQAVGATFTQVGSDNFQEMILQATNMSTTFGQDLKQSIIQLGTALNNPIKGVGRLQRIGISFSQTQRELIKNFYETGQMAQAQQVILDEIEREIGGVSLALGSGMPGAIKKATTAFKNFKIAAGEAFSPVTLAVLSKFTAMFDGMADAHDKSAALTGLFTKMTEHAQLIEGAVGREMTPAELGLPSDITIAEARNGVDEYKRLILETTKAFNEEYNESKTGNHEAGRRKSGNIAVQLKKINDEYKVILAMLEERMTYLTTVEPTTGAADTTNKQRDTWLLNLKAQIAGKEEMLSLDAKASKFDKQRVSQEAWWAKLRSVAWYKHRMTIEELEGATNNYHEKRIMQINREELAYHEMLKAQEESARGADRSNIVSQYGTEEMVDTQAQEEAINALNEAYATGLISFTEWGDMINHLQEEQQSFGSNRDMFDNWMDGLDNAISKTKLMENVLNDLQNMAVDLASDATMAGFKAMGESLAGSKTAADDFSQSVATMAQSALEAASPMFLTAAATAAVGQNYPLAATYLALAAATGIAAGAIGQYSQEDERVPNGATSNVIVDGKAKDFSDTFDTPTASHNRVPTIDIHTLPGETVEAEQQANGDTALFVRKAVASTIQSGGANRAINTQFHVKQRGGNVG